MDEKRHALGFENGRGFARALGAIGRNADIEGFTLADHLHQRAHGFLERHIEAWPMRIENIDIIEPHPL